MGRILAQVTVESVLQPELALRFDALVDTGAYCLTLPTAWKDRLGTLPGCAPVDVETAEGRVIIGDICGPVAIRIDGFRRIFGEVLFVPEAEGSQGHMEPLLGHLTLEQAGIAVDVVRHRLMKVPYLDLKIAAA
jgi:predicted aspartyl protease